MAKERGLWRAVFMNFITSLKPRQFRGDLIGKDLYGNSYYEIKKPQGYLQRPERYFVPAQKEQFDAPMPSEWESWLRGRRKGPPSEEEIAASLAMIKQKQENAAAIAAKFPPAQLASPPEKENSFPEYGSHYEKFPGNKKD